MDAKKIGIILIALLASIVLLGCVQPEQPLATPECAKEGESISYIGYGIPVECCSGLEMIPPLATEIDSIIGYCTANCGNGSCDSIESETNCPLDCVVETGGEEVIGPGYYGSEGEAFDALNDELNEIPDASLEDLEALLGV